MSSVPDPSLRSVGSRTGGRSNLFLPRSLSYKLADPTCVLTLQIEDQFRLAESEKKLKAASKKTRAVQAAPPAPPADESCSAGKGKALALAPVAVPAPVQVAVGPPRRKAAAVDATFVKRMAFILRIVVPSWHSKESLLLVIQSLTLVSRSFISLRIARKGGDGLQAVMERSWKKFFYVLGDFFVSGVAASVVNSALKYLANCITVAFRQRLTTYVHRSYLSDRAYYRAAVLRAGAYTRPRFGST